MTDQLISFHLAPAQALQCQPQITKSLRNKGLRSIVVPLGLRPWHCETLGQATLYLHW